MSYAQGTTHYNFPQIVATDRPTFTDANEAFRTLDTKLYALEGSATEVDGRLDTAEGNIVQLQSDVQTAQGTADLAKNTADTAIEQIGITNTNVSQLTTRVGNKFDSVGIADPYDTAATYSVDDVVTYNGQRYRCTTAVTVAEPFDVTKWTGEDVETVLNQIKSDLAPIEARLADKSRVGTLSALTDGVFFTVPSDGYIRIVGKGFVAFRSSATPDSPTPILVNRIGSGNDAVQRLAVFVRKGMNVQWTNEGGSDANCGFFPLVD